MCGKFNLNSDKVFSIEDFLEIMEILRSPNGCQWDKEQTHKSIMREFLEESYEAVEAIETENASLLQEELGDVLLQIVFHSQIAKELGEFTFEDVVNDICKKLIVRHPHVFADVNVADKDEILTNWDQIKIKTKGQKSLKENIESISLALPALMRYQKFVKKANKYKMMNFETSCDISLSKDNVTEEEIGVALSKIVAIAELSGIDAEKCLSSKTKEDMRNI